MRSIETEGDRFPAEGVSPPQSASRLTAPQVGEHLAWRSLPPGRTPKGTAPKAQRRGSPIRL